MRLSRSWRYPRSLAGLYLCALPIGWASFIGFAITSISGMSDVQLIFGVPFAAAGASLAATAFYLVAHDRSLADEEGRGLFVSSWPLPRGWRASWGRVMLGREVSFALQAFRPPLAPRPTPNSRRS